MLDLCRTRELLTLAVCVLVFTGCEEVVESDVPTTGAITVTSATSGADLDDSFSVALNGSGSRNLSDASSVTFAELEAGSYSVALSGVAENCAADATERTVTVRAGDTAQVSFAVTCEAMTGTVEVTSETTGSDIDPDGYTVTFDGAEEPLGHDEALVFEGVATGDYEIALSDVASNCTVTSSNPASATVTFNQATAVVFAVECEASSAAISGVVTTAASGLQAGSSMYGGASFSPTSGRAASSLPAQTRGARSQPSFVAGELIVRFRPEAVASPGHRALAGMARAGSPLIAEVGKGLREELTSLRDSAKQHAPSLAFEITGVSPVIQTARVRVENPAELNAVAERLRADPRVLSVERNRIVERPAARLSAGTASKTTPAAAVGDDPDFPKQAWHYAMIDLSGAWDITTGSSSVIVAVVDDGIRFDHPGIGLNLTDDGYDFVSNDDELVTCDGLFFGPAADGDGYDPDPTVPIVLHKDEVEDCWYFSPEPAGHGLHVAGTIGALAQDGEGGLGVNRDVAIRPVRVMGVDGGSDYDIAQGILYAAGLPADDGAGGTVTPAHGMAHVINMSIGGPGNNPTQEAAIQAAHEAGALLIGAAGNESSSDMGYPASYPEVMAVSSVNPYGEFAETYSNFGDVDIAAPGGETAHGEDFDIYSTFWDFELDEPVWGYAQGTSMAAPHVAGVAALLFAAEPGITAGAVWDRLTDWAVDAGPEGWDEQFGWGILNARNSLTESFEPAADVYVQLVDAASGAVLAETMAAADGSYEFPDLEDGEYLVYAGQDREGDGLTGEPGRRWGAFGGTSVPTGVTLAGPGTHTASFTIGIPVEAESNGTLADADALLLNSYVRGEIGDASAADADIYKVLIPASGTYVFETVGMSGVCGVTLEEDTYLTLMDADGSTLEENDDVDPSNLCSRISRTLEPGTYYVGVTGWEGEGRRYFLEAWGAN